MGVYAPHSLGRATSIIDCSWAATPPAGNSLIFAVFSLCVRRVFARVRQCVGGMFFSHVFACSVACIFFDKEKEEETGKTNKKKSGKERKGKIKITRNTKKSRKNEKEKEKEKRKRN